MNAATTLALSVSQLVGYLGYVALGGLLMYRALITPDRGHERRVVRLAVVGLGLLAASALSRLVVLLVAGDRASTQVGLPVALVQLGVLVAVACYLPDLLGGVLSTWRRTLAAGAAVLLTVALVLPTIVATSARSAAGGVLTVAHVLALGTWVGGMVAVALLVLPSTAPPRVLNVLQVMLRRSRVTVVVLVTLLLVSGGLALLFQPGPVAGLSPAFWAVLVTKVVLVGVLVVVAAHVRRQIRRAAFRNEHIADFGDVLVDLRRVVRIEVVVAAAAVAATAVLSVLTPLG